MSRTLVPFAVVFALLVIAEQTSGSCYQFGHACFGAHGKRSDFGSLKPPSEKSEGQAYVNNDQNTPQRVASNPSRMIPSYPLNYVLPREYRRELYPQAAPVGRYLDQQVDPSLENFYKKWLQLRRRIGERQLRRQEDEDEPRAYQDMESASSVIEE